MKRTFGKSLLVASILVGGLGQTGEAGSTDSAETGRKIVVHIVNHAQVDRKVLDQAREITNRIFQQAGVEAVVLEHNPETEATDLPHPEVPRLGHLFVDVLPRERVERLGLPANFMGFAPAASHVPERRHVFVFNHMVEKLARTQVLVAVEGKISRIPDKAQILGHAIAHEIGHLLLHMAPHSRQGIMQANWDRAAMHDMAVSRLTFRPEEVERIQAEVVRRTGQSF